MFLNREKLEGSQHFLEVKQSKNRTSLPFNPYVLHPIKSEECLDFKQLNLEVAIKDFEKWAKDNTVLGLDINEFEPVLNSLPNYNSTITYWCCCSWLASQNLLPFKKVT